MPANAAVLATTSFRVSPADIAAANRKHMRWSFARPHTWLVLAGIALIAVIVVAVTTSGAGPVALAGAAGGALAWMIGWGLVVYALFPLLARRSFAKQPNLHHLWRVDLSEGGVRGVTPNQDAFVAWGDYVAWGEDAKVILLYNSDRLFQVVPKHATDAAFLETLHRLVAHLPRR